MKVHTPALTVDIIIRTPKGIVLIERENYPEGWALPGGFVEYGETVEHAALREAREETGLGIRLVRQFHVYSDPKRDTRMHTVTVVFIADAKGAPKAGSDAKNIKVFSADKMPDKMAFDHRSILKDYFSRKY